MESNDKSDQKYPESFSPLKNKKNNNSNISYSFNP